MDSPRRLKNPSIKIDGKTVYVPWPPVLEEACRYMLDLLVQSESLLRPLRGAFTVACRLRGSPRPALKQKLSELFKERLTSASFHPSLLEGRLFICS